MEKLMPEKKKIYLVGGARPNFMKIAPLRHEFKKKNSKFDIELVHTGQHYDYEMSEVFFEDLGLGEPDNFLGVGSGTHGYQTAQVMMRFEELAIAKPVDLVLVVGDVNSTIAVALAAVKLGIDVGHVEAGLRSFDMNMPEEINRILTDRISSLLLASEPSGVKNLIAEGIAENRISLVGNLMIDSLSNNLDSIKTDRTTKQLGLEDKEFVLVTIHRPTNVDDPNSLEKILEILKMAGNDHKLIFPAHPRTCKNMERFNLAKEFGSIKNLEIMKPLGYYQFMNLMINSKYILTDSGGIQEESTWLGIPCITLRENTERPLTCEQGTNRITGIDIDKVSKAIKWALDFDPSGYVAPTLWDGKAASRVVEVVSKYFS
jgi:UDP-N-acetylglucosamine 2-epimerase (non-hydrolysing)